MTDTTNEQLTGPAGATSVEVRRNVALAAAVGTLAGLLTLAFAVRTFAGHGGALDWLALGVMVLVTIAYAGTLVDSRAPLMVVDDRGVRLRQGARWKGIAWPEIECLEHLPRTGLFRDGHLLVVAYDDRQLVVPLTMATRVVGAPLSSLSDVLAELAQGRADVVEVVPGLDGDDTTDDAFAPAEAPVAPPIPPIPPIAPAAETEDTTDLSPYVRATDEDDETGEIEAVHGELEDDTEATAAADQENTEEIVAVEPPAPGRTTILAARVDMAGTDRPSTPYVAPAIDSVPHEESTVVLEELAVHPAAIPVIGPQLAVARQRLKLTIDQLSDRTRIRPHVIEAIEVDDFGPCGGDFYARGHLRTLCRVLGIDAGPLVTTYDNEYADAPVDPRRIFESELATGHGGSIRSTRGGRNWSVLISSVMAAVLIWSVAQLVLGGRAPIENVPQLNQSGGITNGSTAKAHPVKVVLNAAGGGARLIVRDANGHILLDGPLAYGQTANLSVVPPVRIWSSDGSVTVSIAGKPATAIGSTGQEASGTFIAR
ncbi:MAG TPA: helix-turn-helix domain-containing protein [Nocardioides sp.]|nr:helix-turn-helix domain-containing protein [Nocardioides sp.]